MTPEAGRRLDAIDTLYSLEPVPVDQEQWEREYSSLKDRPLDWLRASGDSGPWPGPAGR